MRYFISVSLLLLFACDDPAPTGDNRRGDTLVHGDQASGDPSAGDTMAGDPLQGDPLPGDPVQGDPLPGDPLPGDPLQGDPAVGDPAQGDPQQGDPSQGDPQQSDPQQGDPSGPGDPGPPPVFLQRNGTELTLDGQPFRHIAVNKFDLFYQFLGVASNSPASVTRPQALVAMDDAVDAGICCFRISASPFWPVDMATYQSSPADHWAAFDDMIAELKARDLKVIPTVCWNEWMFADLVGEPLADLFRPSTGAHALLFAYAQELATRYADEDTVLFWDLTNEMNLHVDLDYGSRTDAMIAPGRGTPAARSAADNHTTDDAVALLEELGTWMKTFDGNHLISPGHSRPRPSAMHLRAQPEWSPGGANWDHDSPAEMQQYIALTHGDPIDIVGIHFYPTVAIFGVNGAPNPDQLEYFVQAADLVGKPLFIGEFADTQPPVQDVREANFTRRAMLEILDHRVPLSLVWTWEFYQFAPDAPSPHSIEPNIDGHLIATLTELDGWLASAPATRGAELPVPNRNMELDADINQRVDGWETVWRNGSSTGWSARPYVNAADAFEDTAVLRINSGTGDPASTAWALSDPIAVGGGEDVVVSAAIRSHLTGNQIGWFSLLEYDAGGGTVTETHMNLDPALGWVFRVEHQRVQLDANTRSVRIRFGNGGEEGTLIDIDDVRLSRI